MNNQRFILGSGILGRMILLKSDCNDCKHMIFDAVFGDHKCGVKQRYLASSEASVGCADWSKGTDINYSKDATPSRLTSIYSSRSDRILT